MGLGSGDGAAGDGAETASSDFSVEGLVDVVVPGAGGTAKEDAVEREEDGKGEQVGG